MTVRSSTPSTSRCRSSISAGNSSVPTLLRANTANTTSVSPLLSTLCQHYFVSTLLCDLVPTPLCASIMFASGRYRADRINGGWLAQSNDGRRPGTGETWPSIFFYKKAIDMPMANAEGLDGDRLGATGTGLTKTASIMTLRTRQAQGSLTFQSIMTLWNWQAQGSLNISVNYDPLDLAGTRLSKHFSQL